MRQEEIEVWKTAQGSQERDAANKRLAALRKELAETETDAKRFDGAAGLVAITLNDIGEAAGRVVAQFGRQLFQRAIEEAKRFVVEFDAAMTEIQMVTMKTDAEIQQLGASLVATAINMKVSVSDVTSAATE